MKYNKDSNSSIAPPPTPPTIIEGVTKPPPLLVPLQEVQCGEIIVLKLHTQT